MVRYEIVGREQYTKVVKSGGSSGIIYVPKRYIGRQVVVIIDGDIAISGVGGIVYSDSESSDAVPPLENFGKKVCPPDGDKKRKQKNESVTDTDGDGNE